MPTRRSAYGYQGTRSGARKARRRRTSVATRVRWQKPSARNQQRQLRSVAKIALQNRRMLSANKAYCDFYDGANTSNALSLWYAAELTHPALWAASNREDLDVFVSQTAYWRNMVLEYFVASSTKESRVDVEIYVVSLRNSAANWSIGTGPGGALTQGQDYTTMGQGNAVSLNSGIFKVHYSKTFSIFPRIPQGTSPPPTFSGDADTTYRRGKVNLALNFKVRSPAGVQWKTLNQANLPPNQRMYLIWRGVSQDTTNGFTMNWGSHVTVVSV